MTEQNKKLEEKIQKDLDNGMFGMICSNENTFKRYVFKIIEEQNRKIYMDLLEITNTENAIKLAKDEIKEWSKEIEDLRREILLYFT